jgi:hypothetical protein
MWQFISLRSLACDLLFIKQILTQIFSPPILFKTWIVFVKKWFFNHPSPLTPESENDFLQSGPCSGRGKRFPPQRRGKISPPLPLSLVYSCCHVYFCSAFNKNGPFLSCDMMKFVSFQAVTWCNLWASKPVTVIQLSELDACIAFKNVKYISHNCFWTFYYEA